MHNSLLLSKENNDKFTSEFKKANCIVVTTGYSHRHNLLRTFFDKSKQKPRRLLKLPLYRLKGYKIVDTFDILAHGGVNITSFKEFCVTYEKIKQDEESYKEKRSKSAAQRLFGDYFAIRDFVSAKKYFDIVLV